jgi:hypothetical protein
LLEKYPVEYVTFQVEDLKESIDLNIIFWTFYKNNFCNFIKDYYNGFKSPKDEHQKIINLEKTKALKTANEVPKYSGILNIKGKEKKVLGIQSETLNVLSKNFILKNLDYDLYFFIYIALPPTTMVAKTASIVINRRLNHTIRLIIT